MGFWRSLGSTFGLKSFSSGGWDGKQPRVWESSHLLNHNIGLGASSSDRERIGNDFESYVVGAYKSNGPIFALIAARQFVFSEAVFAWRDRDEDTGRYSQLFTNQSLNLLERPWPGGTTGEMLSQMEQDASLAGNSWWTITNDRGQYGPQANVPGTNPRIVRLRPDWVELVIDSRNGDPWALDNKVVAIRYRPITGGIMTPQNAGFSRSDLILTPDQVAHYSPIPDPIARFRGMSWLTPIINEIETDQASNRHKLGFYENAAVPNLMVKFDKDTSEDDFDEFVENFNTHHRGEWNSYKTLFLMGGADVTPLTTDFKQLEFTQSQGKGESRMAAAAGVPASWVGFSEGLQGSSLNAGNFTAARRRFADGTIRPLWRNASACLEQLVDNPNPTTTHLWFDDRDISFLREDAKDLAEISHTEINAVDAAIRAGYEPDAAAEAVRRSDVGQLIGKHTGTISVQMQAPTSKESREFEEGSASVRALAQAGYSPESIVEAVMNSDLSLLEGAPEREISPPGGNPRQSSGEAEEQPQGESDEDELRRIRDEQTDES